MFIFYFFVYAPMRELKNAIYHESLGVFSLIFPHWNDVIAIFMNNYIA